MKLLELKLENFRSVKNQIVLENLKKITVFVGPNNVGKSNIIKALEFLSKISRNDQPDPLMNFIHDRVESNMEIEITVETTKKERQTIIQDMKEIDHLFTNLDFDNDPIFKFFKYKIVVNTKGYVSESFSITNNKKDFIEIAKGSLKGNYTVTPFDLKNHIKNSNMLEFNQPDFASFQNSSNPLGLLNGLPNQTTQSLIVDMLRHFLRKIKFIPTIRNMGNPAPAQEINEFDFNAPNAPQVMNTMLQNDTEEFVKLTQELKNCLPKINKITSPLSGSNVTIRISEPGLSSQTSIDEFSDGIKQTFGIYLLNKTTPSNGLICLEEPEISLHSHTQKKLFQLLRDNSNIQYIITTHSPIFTAINEDVKTFLITKPDGVSQIREISDRNELIFIKKELGIKNSDTFGYDAVLFVEGYSEEEAIKILAPALGYDEIGTQIRLTNLEGTGAVSRLKQLLDYLKGSDSEIFIIVDKHRETMREIPKLLEQRLLKEDHVTIWESNFEDTFQTKQIIQAMNNLCMQNQYKFSLTSEHLENKRKTRGVYPVISEHFFQLNNKSLRKSDLSKELSYVLISEMRTNPQHNFSEIEQTLHQIMKKLVLHQNDLRLS